MCCVTMWSPLLQRRERHEITICSGSTSIYRQWRRAMALVFVHLGSGNKWVVVNNHTISGNIHRHIKGNIETLCESTIQSVLTQTMALASAQGKHVTWVAMGDWNFYRVQGFLAVLRKVPYPAGMEDSLSNLQMSGSHRDFMVSNSPMQKQVLENQVEAMDGVHKAVFCNIAPCSLKRRLQEPALAPAQSSFADAAQSDVGKVEFSAGSKRMLIKFQRFLRVRFPRQAQRGGGAGAGDCSARGGGAGAGNCSARASSCASAEHQRIRAEAAHASLNAK